MTAADLAAGKGLNMTRDLGVATANFTSVLSRDVGPFLVQTAPFAVSVPPPAYDVVNWVGYRNTLFYGHRQPPRL